MGENTEYHIYMWRDLGTCFLYDVVKIRKFKKHDRCLQKVIGSGCAVDLTNLIEAVDPEEIISSNNLPADTKLSYFSRVSPFSQEGCEYNDDDNLMNPYELKELEDILEIDVGYFH